MRVWLIVLSLFSNLVFADSILTVPRKTQGVLFNTSQLNIPASPISTPGSLVLSSVGSAQHLNICHETSKRLRVSFGNSNPRSDADVPVSNDSNKMIPAATSGSFVCRIWDDVQIGQAVYVWADGSAATSGMFYADVW